MAMRLVLISALVLYNAQVLVEHGGRIPRDRMIRYIQLCRKGAWIPPPRGRNKVVLFQYCPNWHAPKMTILELLGKKIQPVQNPLTGQQFVRKIL